MAGNENSGRLVTFPHSEKKLAELIAQYKADLENGVFARASWPHFAAFLECTEDDLAEVIKLGDKATSAYYQRGKMLKKMATWVRGQYMSAQGWNGQLTSRAIFALKQDIGDGVKWSDTDNQPKGPVEVKISFGGDDKRAKEAAK